MEYTYKDMPRAYKDNISVSDFISNTNDGYCKICYTLANILGTKRFEYIEVPFVKTILYFGKSGYFLKLKYNFEFDGSIYLLFNNKTTTNNLLIVCNNKILKYSDSWNTLHKISLEEKFYFKVKTAFER